MPRAGGGRPPQLCSGVRGWPGGEAAVLDMGVRECVCVLPCPCHTSVQGPPSAVLQAGCGSFLSGSWLRAGSQTQQSQ